MRERASCLGLVTLDQMVAALVRAVENSAKGVKVVGVLEIRSRGRRHLHCRAALAAFAACWCSASSSLVNSLYFIFSPYEQNAMFNRIKSI